MNINRRSLMGLAIAGILSAISMPALALTTADARAHVETTMNELLALLDRDAAPAVRASELKNILEARGNIPLLAKFSAGRAWREMSSGQQDRFIDAFSHFVSVTYARRFGDFNDKPSVTIGRVIDAGRKGILVESPISMDGRETLEVEWLVSDRAGSTQVIDLVVEGVSMAATQREELTSMLERRGGDVNALISFLSSAKAE